MGQSYSYSTILGGAALVLAGLVAYAVNALGLLSTGGSLRALRGPGGAHPLLGHVREIMERSPLVDEWLAEYGRVIRCAGLLKVRPLLLLRRTCADARRRRWWS
jgi:hypothetical protein